jgi:nicotinamidase-related amidase
VKALHNIYVNRDNAILVVVDVENEFCKPGGKMYNETIAKIMPSVVPAIQKLLEQARSASIPIIYIQSMRTLEEAEFTVWKLKPILKQGTWASEIVDEIKPQKDDFVVPKFTHDPFLRPDLDKVLRKLVSDPTKHYAIVTGGAVNVCLYHTVMGFHLRDYWVVVPIDSVYYMSEAGYQRALEQFSEGGPYPNVFLSRSDLIKVTQDHALLNQRPVPGS